MDRALRSGTALKRLHDSAIARMNSTVKSNFRVTLFQVIILLIPSQRGIQMVSPLPCRSRASAMLRLAPSPSGGATETAKAPRNGTVLKRLPDSAIARKISTRRSRNRPTSYLPSTVAMTSQPLTLWASPSFKKVSDYIFEIISQCFCCYTQGLLHPTISFREMKPTGKDSG